MRAQALIIALVACLQAFAAPWQAGQVVASPEALIAEGDAFTAVPLDSALLQRMEQGGSRPKGGAGAISADSLRYLRLLHRNLKGQAVTGEMIVAADLADEVIDIFRELYNMGYPIERMQLIDDYGASDPASMAANNTSAYCHRPVAGTSKLSLHARGRAIDLNPLYNPWVKPATGKPQRVQPEEGRPWADRSRADNPYAITPPYDAALRLFKAHGWTWGGSWRSLRDYQHFEKK